MKEKLNYPIPDFTPGFWDTDDTEKYVWTFRPLWPEDPHAPKKGAALGPARTIPIFTTGEKGERSGSPQGWGGWRHPDGTMEYWGINNPTESWQKDLEEGARHTAEALPLTAEAIRNMTYDPSQDPSSAWYKAFKKWGGRDFPRSSLSPLTVPEDATDQERISILELEITMLENKLINVTAMRDRLNNQLMEFQAEHRLYRDVVQWQEMAGDVHPDLGTVVPAIHPDHGTCIAWYQCGQWIVISTISNQPTVVSLDCIKWYKKISPIQKNTVTSH